MVTIAGSMGHVGHTWVLKYANYHLLIHSLTFSCLIRKSRLFCSFNGIYLSFTHIRLGSVMYCLNCDAFIGFPVVLLSYKTLPPPAKLGRPLYNAWWFLGPCQACVGVDIMCIIR